MLLGSVAVAAALTGGLQLDGARLDLQRGTVRFVGPVAGFRGEPRAAARAFLSAHGRRFGADAPRLRRVSTDALGHTRVEFEQTFRGLPVRGAALFVHFDGTGDLVAAQGWWVPRLRIETEPSYPLAGGTLVVFDPGLVTKGAPDPHLAWEVDLDPRETLYLDAHTGALLFVSPHVHTVLERTMYDGDYGAAFQVWTETDGPYVGGDTEIEDLIAYTEDTYQLFDNISGGTYPSFDGESAVMEAVASAALECPNAQWDGTSTNYCNGLTADDVVGHEWGHAYSQYSHALIYAYQPGALNEAYSDIFGETVDLLNGAGTDAPGGPRTDGMCSGDGDSVRWLIGEDTVGLGVIRDMWAPACNGQPGRVGAGQYVCSGSFFDNGGVHSNSGVPNHAFALLVDGGSYNLVDVAAIGMTKALAIYWRAMTVYQSTVSGFADHADALEAACADLMNAAADLPDPLTGAASGEVIVQEDCDAVEDAMDATEMRDTSICETGPLFDTDDPPAPCDEGVDPLIVFEEDFEGDLSAWTLGNEGVAAEYEPRDWVLVDALPADRPGQGVFANGDLYLGDCDDDDQSGVMHLDSPAIDIPNEPGQWFVTFEHWLASEPYIDGGNLEVSVDGGAFTSIPTSAFTFNGYNTTLDDTNNPLAGQSAFSGSDAGLVTGSWVASQADLSVLIGGGDSVVLRFNFGVNECNGLFGWYVDDVRVEQCSVEGGSTGTSTGSATSTGADTGSGSGSGTDPGTGTGPDSASGADTGSASASGSGPGTLTASGSGTATDGETDTDADDGGEAADAGCGCSAPRAPGPPVGLVVLLVLATSTVRVRPRPRRGRATRQ